MINMFSSSADVSSVLLIFTLCELFLYRSKYMLYYHLFYASKIDDFIFRKTLFWILFGIGLWPSYYLSWEARDQCTFQEVAGYRVGWTSIPKGNDQQFSMSIYADWLFFPWQWWSFTQCSHILRITDWTI